MVVTDGAQIGPGGIERLQAPEFGAFFNDGEVSRARDAIGKYRKASAQIAKLRLAQSLPAEDADPNTDPYLQARGISVDQASIFTRMARDLSSRIPARTSLPGDSPIRIGEGMYEWSTAAGALLAVTDEGVVHFQISIRQADMAKAASPLDQIAFLEDCLTEFAEE